MPVEDREFGRFESLVLERLDALRAMGTEIKACQASMKERLNKLEHAETRLKTFAAICGAIASCCVAIVMKWVFK